jgi:ABC-type nitrate/sulfonate/bicarbonate transport system substrate-binding protein
VTRALAVRIALIVALGSTGADAAMAATVRIGVPERANIQFLTLWVALGAGYLLAATRDYAAAHPDVLLAVTRAIARAENVLHTDADAAARALLKAGIPAPSPKHLATIVDIYRAAVPATPRVSAAAVERNATLYPARPAMPDFTKVHAADFIAPAFAEQAAAGR